MNDYLDFWSGPDDFFGEEETVDAAEDDAGFVGSVTAVVYSGEAGTSDVFDLDSDDATKIGYLPDGTEVIVVESDDDWRPDRLSGQPRLYAKRRAALRADRGLHLSASAFPPSGVLRRTVFSHFFVRIAQTLR